LWPPAPSLTWARWSRLNIFNTKYVLANQVNATDVDFGNIESVVGQVSTTGNRITCRDWFQLSLKEGSDRLSRPGIQPDLRRRAGPSSA
jgi:aminopeptidase N